jgi:hypothetical protein
MDSIVKAVVLKNAVVFASMLLCGCGMFNLFDDSYQKNVESDLRIVDEIINANPVLDSAKNAGHAFAVREAKDPSYLAGNLDLSGLGLNDSNFVFPSSISGFRIINVLSIGSNHFTKLPQGIKFGHWKAIWIIGNQICNPDTETIVYLDRVAGELSGKWSTLQKCTAL